RRPNADKSANNPPLPEIGGASKEDEELAKQIKQAEEAYENMQQMTVLDQLYVTLRDITFSMQDTKIYNVIHIRPNDIQAPEYDHSRVKSQIHAFLIPDLVVRSQFEYANYYTFGEFLMRYESFIASLQLQDASLSDKEKIERALAIMNWNASSVFVGHEMVWLKYEIWKELEDGLRLAEKEERARTKATDFEASNIDSKGMSQTGSYPAQGQYLLSDNYNYGDDEMRQHLAHPGGHGYEDNISFNYSEDKREVDGSQWGEESEWGINGLSEGFGPNMDMSKMIEDIQAPKFENVEEVPITATRRWWVRFVWLCTFWIPSFLLSWIGKMKRSDIQMAWREKVTICMVIAFLSAIVLFLIVGLGEVVCPGTKYMYSTSDVSAHNIDNDNYMSIRGNVYDMTKFAKSKHGSSGYTATEDEMTTLAGYDVSSSIPPPLTVACSGLVTTSTVKLIANTTVIPQSSFVHYSGDQLTISTLTDMSNAYWYWQTFLPKIQDYRKGSLVHLISDLKADADGWGRNVLAMNGKVYDIQDYTNTVSIYGSTNAEYSFLNEVVTDFFNNYRGTDATEAWNTYKNKMTSEEQDMNMACLDNYFMIGQVDERKTARCMFTNYLLLVLACFMVSVTVVKFLAALQFGSAPTPEDHDKFVICQVPCYTEDEQSLRRTIDSLTTLKYDDKRKLLFLIADGMVMGSGNDRPTPRIVLDILGYDTKIDPEPLMFKSIGEGSKQLNYGKVYSGLYECEGHVVPYIVVAKVGKASERAKPGNRGKRDSQMILMNFLNRVHFDSEMTPLELEMYHQIKNVIGVNPSFYEYILMVDSDTEVMDYSLNYLISSMLHDGRVIAICGETALANENQSWTTMIQVYEYYISHYLSKAFESLFGSVTCLPGCFCMYRIRTPVKNEPLIISPHVVHDYSENHVDTLHKKNLLSLGEDRYLTTLMMKYFPQYKMKFTPYAMCKTVAPDKWRVLLSQRRRWINSTIHNLCEVVMLPDLCGFCFFSMRFVVLTDLIGTITLPVSFAYLVYLIYVIASGSGPLPVLALAMIAGSYGLQILIFILKRQWQHIGWMFFYIFSLPFTSFILPIYSFWHFDDFSWDEEKFDEKMIPMKKWSVYEQELWEMGSHASGQTGMTGNTYSSYNKGGIVPPGYDARSQYSGSVAGGDFDYYRDSKIGEKLGRNTRQSSYAYNTAGPGSVVGSEYGSSNMIPMGDYGNRSMMATPPPGMPMRPMSYASADYMSQIQPMMGPNMYNNPMSFDPNTMGAPSPAFNQGQRNSSFDHVSTFSSHMINQQPAEYDIPMGNVSQVSVPPMMPAGFPADDEILHEIRNILATADLMSITKKQVREQLSQIFGCDMSFKKEFINSSIEQILQGHL
ncbi:hypothetical protein CU098_000517, partial [Rhizopus stolonifer]